jgi:uncharacterized protein (TIGR03067 family)
VVVVHPWGVDDGQGWRTPEPAGAAFQCTPAKNAIVLNHGRDVIDPLLKALRSKVKLVGYSLPGKEDPVRKLLYRSARGKPTDRDRAEGEKRLAAALNAFPYDSGGALPATIAVSPETPTRGYLAAFPGLDATPRYDPKGFWDLPIPVMKTIGVAPDDVVFYDGEGYPLLRDYLKAQGITHVLLAGYNTDMCVCSTTAGYKNLRQDFDVFLVGDATIATFPGNPSPRFATNAAVSFAALDLFITQSSWVKQGRSPLIGTWRSIHFEHNGNVAPEGEAKATLTLGDGGNALLKTDGGEVALSYAVDASTSPGRITLTYEQGPLKSSRQYGIYKVEGGKLTLCVAAPKAPEEERPKEFKTEGKRYTLVVHERVDEK